MLRKFKALLLSLTIVAMLLNSAFGVTTAYADEGTGTETPAAGATVTPDVGQPADPGTEATPIPTEEVAPSETSVVETPVPDEGTQPTGEPVATEASAEAEVIETIMETVPDNTTVTVLNAEGEVLPLASQESADAIAADYDPIWCPEGQAPTPGANGCTGSYNSFTALLSFLKTNEGDAAYQQAGTIYVQKDAYLGGESSINFNSYNFQHINNYDLTVHGGWDTVDNSVEATDTTSFNVPIIVGTSTNPWIGSLTFSNISISNVSNQTGLTLFTQGDITLSNVAVTNSQSGTSLNADGNVDIQNSKFNNNKKSGAVIKAGGDVDIQNSEFNNNASSKYDGSGLEIDNTGNVSLTQVVASHNEKFGADVSTAGKVTISNSVFSGNVSYTYDCSHMVANGGYGLKVASTSPVSLDGVTANDNYLFGAHMEGSEVEVLNSSFNKNGSGSLDNPKGYGLEVISASSATLSGVTANENQLFGANVKAVDSVIVTNSFFNGNKSYSYTCKGKKTYLGYGLQVVTTGAIVLDKVTASDNYLFGADLSGADVVIDHGTFSSNGSEPGSSDLIGKGLKITSTGIVTLSNVEANKNQLFGADIKAVGDVTINNSFFSGQKTYAYDCRGNIKYVNGGGYGLKVFTNGTVALHEVEAADNLLYGAQLEGSTVEVSDGNFSNNGSGAEDKPIGFGLKVISTGNVTLVGVEANNNQLFGADVKAGNSVTVANSFFSGHQAYAFDPCRNQVNYYGYGLKVVTTAGTISLDGVEANHNNLWGASLTGLDVTIANSIFNNNVTESFVFIDDTGLLVESTGNVTLDNVQANENRLIGASIHATGDVLINESVFSGNQGITCQDQQCRHVIYNGYGLNVVAGGLIELNEVTANENNLFGAHLEGSSVFVLNSIFNNNGSGDKNQPTGRGLEVISTGDVTLMNVNASYNELFGANIQADGLVTVNNSIFSGNKSYTYSCKGNTYYGYGLKVVTTDDVYLNTVTANENNLFGASLTGSYVDVSDSSFNYNSSGSDKNPTGKGLEIKSSGDVSLLHSEANYNQLFGASIEADGDVTVLTSAFAGNQYYTYTCKGTSGQGYGLKVVAAGNIVLGAAVDDPGFGVQAYDNGAEGAILVGQSTIEVADSSFYDNGADGLKITANGGNVTLTNVTATGNGGDGVDVTGTCTNTVFVNGGTITDNGQYGIKTTNITYTPNGTQTFANNSSGNVFQNSTCNGSNTNGSGQNSQGSQIPWWLLWLWNKYH